MITIDGSQGEGGGQILRTSLGLSLVTGQAVRIEKIRAKRSKPGLLRQHLTALQAAAAIGQAEITGDFLGARELTFKPNGVHSDDYHFAVGTAGSTSLVLQTVLPALMLADGPTTLTLEGGTHNPFAPPFPFLEKAFLPLVNRMGPQVEAELVRAGFYPAGGGRVVYRVTPTEKLQPLELHERGAIHTRQATAFVVNLPEHIAERELKIVGRKLSWEADWLQTVVHRVNGGPGNVITIEIASDNVTEVFTAFGEKGRTAETVAEEAVKQARRYLAGAAVAGEYLTDQLLLPMALAGGGTFTTSALSQHTLTNIETIKKFLDVTININETASRLWRVNITNAAG